MKIVPPGITRAPWHYEGHEITVDNYGFFCVDAHITSYPTMHAAYDEIDKLKKHEQAAVREPLSLAALTGLGPTTITGISRNNGEYTVQPSDRRALPLYPDTPAVAALLTAAAAARKALDILNAQLAKCAVAQARTSGYGKISADAYPALVLQAKENYATALAAAKLLEVKP